MSMRLIWTLAGLTCAVGVVPCMASVLASDDSGSVNAVQSRYRLATPLQSNQLENKSGDGSVVGKSFNVNAALGYSFNVNATGVLGLTLAPVDEALVAHLGLKPQEGLVVTGLQARGLGEKSGLKPHDIIAEFDGKPVRSAKELDDFVKAAGDSQPKLTILRRGKRQPITIAGMTRREKPESRYWLGIPIAPADATLREQLGLDSTQALVITDVSPDSPAKKAGIQKNDLLLDIDGDKITTAEELIKKIQKSEGKPLTIGLLRAGKPLTIRATPEERPESTAVVGQLLLGTAPANPQHSQEFLFQPGVLIDPTNLDVNLAGTQAATKLLRMEGNNVVVWDLGTNRVASEAQRTQAIERIETLLKQSQELLRQIKATQNQEMKALQDELKQLKEPSGRLMKK